VICKSTVHFLDREIANIQNAQQRPQFGRYKVHIGEMWLRAVAVFATAALPIVWVVIRVKPFRAYRGRFTIYKNERAKSN
jgi:hypothetical protein